MEVVAFKMQPKNTYTRTVHGTENRQWVCVNDLEKSLRTTRINVRGKESVKLNVNGKPRRFMHKKHLELILGRKPSSNMVASWLRRVFLKSHTMKVEAEIRTMTKQLAEKRNRLLKEEAKFILSDNAAGMREFVIRTGVRRWNQPGGVAPERDRPQTGIGGGPKNRGAARHIGAPQVVQGQNTIPVDRTRGCHLVGGRNFL